MSSWLLRVAWMLAIVSSLAGQEPWTEAVELPPRSVQDRGGLHHATLVLRCVDEKGRAVAGAEVVAFALPEGWGPAPVPLAHTLSDADGAVKLKDVCSPHPVIVRLTASGFQEKHVCAVAPSGTTSDLGAIVLDRGIILSGRVEIIAEDGSSSPVTQGQMAVTIANDDNVSGKERVAGVQLRDGWFRLDGVDPLEEACVEVTFFSDDRWCVFEAAHALAGHAKVVLRAKEATLKQDGYRWKGELEIVSAPDLEVKLAPVIVRGRVIDPDERPLGGCRVHTFGWGYREMGSAEGWGVTDDEGRFTLTLAEVPNSIVVEGPFGSYQRIGLRGDFDPAEPLEIQVRPMATLPFTLSGADPGAARFSFGTAEAQWLPCAMGDVGGYVEDRSTLGYSQHGLPASFRAEAEGWIPQVASLDENSEAVKLSFEGGVPFNVRVTRGRVPLRQAWVDVDLLEGAGGEESSASPSSRTRLEVARLRSDAKGRISLRAHEEHAYEVFAYAEGYEPAAASWIPGKTMMFRLARRRISVRLEGLGGDEAAKILGSESGTHVAVANSATPTVKLAEGSYDAVVLSPTGAVLRGRRFVIDRRTKRISLAPDERPTLTVLLPEGESTEGWTAVASRRVPPLGSVGAAAWTVDAGFDGEPAATIEPEPPRTLRVILPAAGRYVLTLTPAGVGFSLLRDVLASPKAAERLAVPTIEITVHGSASGFPRNFEGSHHGVAGPRLLLVAAPQAQGGSGWDVLVGLPKSTGRSGAFRFGPIPRGHYFLHQHLTDLDTGAWGGLPVLLNPDQTDLPDWSTVAPADLEIQVSDSKGKPITNGILSLRDPMAESWREFMRLPTTATLADHPIPSPPSVRLEGRPVTLPRIRPGHVEFEVETATGQRFRFHRIIDDDKPLQLQLPPE